MRNCGSHRELCLTILTKATGGASCSGTLRARCVTAGGCAVAVKVVSVGVAVYRTSVVAINADLLAVGGAQLLFNSLLRGLREVGRLDVLLNADQRLLQCVERAGVQHLLLNLSGVGAP